MSEIVGAKIKEARKNIKENINKEEKPKPPKEKSKSKERKLATKP